MDFVTNFLRDHPYDDEEILEYWNTEENAAEIEKIMKEFNKKQHGKEGKRSK